MKIVKLCPSDTVFSITWVLSRRCNYDCMYCPSNLHDATSKHPDLAELQQNWEDIVKKTSQRNLKYKIGFTGGELTGNRDFLPFVHWLREHYSDSIHQLLLTTNGSATAKYYIKLFKLIDNISFSTHSEHMDEQKFFDMLQQVFAHKPPANHIHVNIMDEFWNQNRILMYKQRLTDMGISYSVNQIDYSQQIRSMPILQGKLNLEL